MPHSVCINAMCTNQVCELPMPQPQSSGSSGFNTDNNAGGDGMDSSSAPSCNDDAACKTHCEQMASQFGMNSATMGCDKVTCNRNTNTCSDPSYFGTSGGHSGGFNTNAGASSGFNP